MLVGLWALGTWLATDGLVAAGAGAATTAGAYGAKKGIEALGGDRGGRARGRRGRGRGPRKKKMPCRCK